MIGREWSETYSGSIKKLRSEAMDQVLDGMTLICSKSAMEACQQMSIALTSPCGV